MIREFEMSDGMRFGTSLIKRMLQLGMPMGPLMLLSHVGRKTGRLYETPVALVKGGETRWLVSPFGEVNWVQNVRESGGAQLRRGSRLETISLIELDEPGLIAPILKRFLSRFRLVPFIPPYFDATPQSPIEDFEREVSRHPVFRIEASDRLTE